MQKVLSIILIITIILCVLAFPLFHFVKNETVIKRNVVSTTESGSQFPRHYITLTEKELYDNEFSFYVSFNTTPNAIVNDYNSSTCNLWLLMNNEHNFALCSLPCYYYLSERNSVSETVTEICIRFDFLRVLQTSEAFEVLGNVYDFIDESYAENGSNDTAVELFELFEKFFLKTELFFIFSKCYFDFFTLKGVE